MKKIKIDVARFSDTGDVRKAYSLGRLQLPDPRPIVPTLEIEGRHYTVTSLGMGSAEAYELRHLHNAPETPFSVDNWTGRHVTRRGVEYVLCGPVKLVAAEVAAVAASEPEIATESATAADQIAAAEALLKRGMRDPVVAAAIKSASATVGSRVAQMQAEVDAEIAAARARVEAATPEQLAQKRTPLPPLGPDEFEVYVTPGGVGVVDISPREPEPPTAEELRTALFGALHSFQNARERWAKRRSEGMTDAELKRAIGEEFAESGGHYAADGHWEFDGGKHPKLWVGRGNHYGRAPDLHGRALVNLARELLEIPLPEPAAQNAPETHQAPAAASETASAASDTPQPEMTPAELAAGYQQVIEQCREMQADLDDIAADVEDGGTFDQELQELAADVAETKRLLRTAKEAPQPAKEPRFPGPNASAEERAAFHRWFMESEPPVSHDGAAWKAAMTRPQVVPVDLPPYTEVPLGFLHPSPHNPRAIVEDDALRELAASIRERGVIQPLVVRPLPDRPGEYELIAGERRLRAAGIAGLTYVPCIISQARTEAEIRTVQLVENLQRADLNAVEVARAYRDMAGLGLTQEQIGAAVGKSQETVANALRLLALPADVLDRISGGELSASHGRALLRFRETPSIQSLIAEFASTTDDARQASVRYLESTPLPFAEELRACGIVQTPVVTVAPPAPAEALPNGAAASPVMQVAPPAMAGAKGGERAPARNGGAPPDNAVEAAILEHRDLARDRAEELRSRIFAEVGKYAGALVLSPRVHAVLVAQCVRYVNRETLVAVCEEMQIAFPEGFDLSDWQRPEVLDELATLNPACALELAFRCVIGHELAWKPRGMPAPLCEWLAGENACPECGGDGTAFEHPHRPCRTCRPAGDEGEQAMRRVEQAVA